MAYPFRMAFGSRRWVRMPCLGLGLFTSLASAQTPPNAAFPAEAPPAPTPAPAPAAQPAPAPLPAPAPPPAPSPAATPETPALAPSPSPAPAAQQPYDAGIEARPGYGSVYEPPPPPAPPAEEPSAIPAFSVRLDPFNWLLEGRLGLELEIGVTKWISLETVPMFVVNDSPPLFNLSGHEDNLYQHSNGIGPLAGATLGVNFWLSGKTFKGYVLRAGLTNYAIEYETRDGSGERVDSVAHTERQFYGILGWNDRWGAFTLAGGIGLGYELNQQSRCFPNDTVVTVSDARTDGCDDELQIALDDPLRRQPVNLKPWLHPFDILVRFSLGVTID
jgi:hypothetical protein